MNLHEQLSDRAACGQPVRVGLIGAGKFATMYVAQALHTNGVQLVGVADLTLQRARAALNRARWPAALIREATTSDQINDAAAHGQIAICEDAMAVIGADLDVIVECTGVPEVAVVHSLDAMDAGHHLVMVSVEADALLGPLLQRRAQRAGVVTSMAWGDQPAIACAMVDWARTCGFQVVAAGKGTKYLPHYHHVTPETVFEHYGFSREQVAQGDFNATMFTSFLDGSKSAIEMAAVSNATGLIPQDEGLHFPPAGIDDLPEVLKPEADGGILTRTGTVEVVSSVHRDGSAVQGDLRWGVYITITSRQPYVAGCFAEYGMQTDRSGRFTAMYRPYHLVGLELGWTVAAVALNRQATGTARQFIADVGAAAKQDLPAGRVLDGEGGMCVYGKLLPATTSLAGNVLPLGLAAGARVLEPIGRDKILRYDQVELDRPERQLVMLRRELEQEARTQAS